MFLKKLLRNKSGAVGVNDVMIWLIYIAITISVGFAIYRIVGAAS